MCLCFCALNCNYIHDETTKKKKEAYESESEILPNNNRQLVVSGEPSFTHTNTHTLNLCCIICIHIKIQHSFIVVIAQHGVAATAAANFFFSAYIT